MDDLEICAIEKIQEALAPLDEEARLRVLNWANSKFFPKRNAVPVKDQDQNFPIVLHGNQSRAESMVYTDAGRILESGELKITVRDLKAKSMKDAAIRLAHIGIFLYQRLAGESSVSSRKVITPLLKRWRVYDGNTRNAVANCGGVIRDGDNLTLDEHACQDAEKFIQECLDDSIPNGWRP